MSRLSNAAAWILSGTLFLVVVVWTNLSGLGIGGQSLTYDDVALPRFAVALVGAAVALIREGIPALGILIFLFTMVTPLMQTLPALGSLGNSCIAGTYSCRNRRGR